jgi:hypothetical protein
MSQYIIPSFDALPPMACRLLAGKRRHQKALTDREIAEISGLSRQSVIAISRKRTWRWMRLDTIQRFSLACGVNLRDDPKKHIKFIQGGMRGHLKNACPKLRKKLLGLLAELKRSQ